MLHELRLDEKYCDDVYYGNKTFEIRLNDRNFKFGDFIHFSPINSDGLLLYHPLSNFYYVITYVLSDFCGLAEKYVALGISKVSFSYFHSKEIH